ncbi:unnamed protein product [Protopolystoma xenopodis]|uniref:Uncharacterized protein n=1 Tax=Protopolystoma xenopodis TaxID=117903 RepID=A0A3S5B770_9PLAT|nr:unnamed protein product [Protopolystoma xenopodis]
MGLLFRSDLHIGPAAFEQYRDRPIHFINGISLLRHRTACPFDTGCHCAMPSTGNIRLRRSHSNASSIWICLEGPVSLGRLRCGSRGSSRSNTIRYMHFGARLLHRSFMGRFHTVLIDNVAFGGWGLENERLALTDS